METRKRRYKEENKRVYFPSYVLEKITLNFASLKASCETIETISKKIWTIIANDRYTSIENGFKNKKLGSSATSNKVAVFGKKLIDDFIHKEHNKILQMIKEREDERRSEISSLKKMTQSDNEKRLFALANLNAGSNQFGTTFIGPQAPKSYLQLSSTTDEDCIEIEESEHKKIGRKFYSSEEEEEGEEMYLSKQKIVDYVFNDETKVRRHMLNMLESDGDSTLELLVFKEAISQAQKKLVEKQEFLSTIQENMETFIEKVTKIQEEKRNARNTQSTKELLKIMT